MEVERIRRRSKTERLKNLFKSGELSDCTFIVQGEEIKAHKLFLKCSSPLFEAMFYGIFASDIINITDTKITAKNFHDVIEYIYTNDVTITSVEHAWNLYYIGNIYLLDDFKSACLNYIEENLSLSTMALSYEYAELYNEIEFKKKLFHEMTIYIRGLFSLSSPDYYHMKKSTLLELIRQNFLNITSTHLIEAICIWAINEYKDKHAQIKILDVFKILNDLELMPFVRDLKNDIIYDKSLCGFIKMTVAFLKSLDNKPETYRNIKQPSWSMFCLIRNVYKMAGRYQITPNDILTTVLTVSKKVALYGLVLFKPDEYSDNFNQTTDRSIFIKIIDMKDNQDSLLITRYNYQEFCSQYIYIPLDDVTTLVPDRTYKIQIMFTNPPLTIVRYRFMEDYLFHKKRKTSFAFSEFDGGIVSGLFYYPI